jgi:murein endopeptidase
MTGRAIAAAALLVAGLAVAARGGACPKGASREQVQVATDNDTWEKAARRLGVRADDLRKWNPGRARDRKLLKNATLFYCQPPPVTVGRPSGGRLVNGISIDPDGDRKGNGFVIAEGRTRLFGTRETIAGIKSCIAEYRKTWRNAAPVSLGDLSGPGGGAAGPHLSHENGRDVDIGYVLTTPQSNGAFNRAATASNLDARKQYTLTRCFLRSTHVKVIFMGAPVVQALKAWIDKEFRRRPRDRRDALGLMAHKVQPDNEHLTHMHVRFKCPKSDRKCVE